MTEKVKQIGIPVGIAVTILLAIIIPLFSYIHARDMRDVEDCKEIADDAFIKSVNNGTAIEILKESMKQIKSDIGEIKTFQKEQHSESQNTNAILREVLREVSK